MGNGKFDTFAAGPHVPVDRRSKAGQNYQLGRRLLVGRTKESAACTSTKPLFRKRPWTTLRVWKKRPSRDHACWASNLNLFSIQELAGAGLIFWHPKGGIIRKIMEDWMREECLRRGYVPWSSLHMSCPRAVEDQRHEVSTPGQHVQSHGNGRLLSIG